MKTLSKLIRDVAEPGFWWAELHRAAGDAGDTSGQTVQAAWQAVSEVLDSVIVLAFDYRHHDEDFLPALKEWHSFLGQRLNSEGDGDLEATILAEFSGKVEATYQQFEHDKQAVETVRLTRPQKLDASNVQYAREVSAHLRKAAAKVRRIEKTTATGKFEMEIYRSILESAIRHFDEMGEAEMKEAA